MIECNLKKFGSNNAHVLMKYSLLTFKLKINPTPVGLLSYQLLWGLKGISFTSIQIDRIRTKEVHIR